MVRPAEAVDTPALRRPLRGLVRVAVQEDRRAVEWRVPGWNRPAIDFYHAPGARRIAGWQVRQLGGEALRALARGTTDG